MFLSKSRKIVFPQSEHARLAGLIALHWGNDSFDRPALDFRSFVAGVSLHDLGHGFLDTNAIGAMDPRQALASMRAQLDCRLPDPIADTVAHVHHARLVAGDPACATLADTCARLVEAGVERSRVSPAAFLRADRITAFCDRLSFDFCFEAPSTFVSEICPRRDSDETRAVSCALDGEGRMVLDPWPLGVAELAGHLQAFQREGYPRELRPLWVAYRIVPGNRK